MFSYSKSFSRRRTLVTYCCVGSLWLVHEGLHWIHAHPLKSVHEGQKNENPFAGHHVQKWLVITLLTWCKSKESSEITDPTHQATCWSGFDIFSR